MKEEELLRSSKPKALGRYRMVQRVGLGGMGEVWLAEDPKLHRQVAIKTLPQHNLEDDEFRQRFEREARAAATLNHPHILPVHDYGEEILSDGQVVTYLVMTYVAGGTLTDRMKDLVKQRTLMPQYEALDYLSQAAEAIDYAHAQNVVHRDIKPSNMLMRQDKWLLLTDFGIARILSDNSQLTQAGVGVGTPEYMAPEQAQGRPEAASDNYSLAVIAYQLLTGRLPFTADTPYATTILHLTSLPPMPRKINPNLSAQAEQVLLCGLAKNPPQRYPTAYAFVNELRRALSDTSPVAITETPTMLPGYPQTPVNLSPLTPRTASGMIDKGQKIHSPPDKGGLTRRGLLIGGGVALLAAGGLGTWAATSWLNRTASQPQSSTPTPTPDPDAPILALSSHTSYVTSLAWSPSTPGLLASGGKDSRAMIWDTAAIQQQEADPTQAKATQNFNEINPIHIGWSPDGKYLAIANTETQIDLQSGEPLGSKADLYEADLNKRASIYNDALMTFSRTLDIKDLAWAPGKYLATVSFPTENVETGKYLVEFRDPLDLSRGLTSIHMEGFTYAITPAPDGSLWAIADGSGIQVGGPEGVGKTSRWLSASEKLTFGKEVFPMSDVTWSPDGRYIAAINNHNLLTPGLMPDSLLGVWDWREDARDPHKLALPSPETVLTCLSWSPAPTSTRLAVGSKDGFVLIWDIDLKNFRGNNLPARRLKGRAGEVTTLAWTSDGRYLAAGYKDVENSILIWKL